MLLDKKLILCMSLSLALCEGALAAKTGPAKVPAGKVSTATISTTKASTTKASTTKASTTKDNAVKDNVAKGNVQKEKSSSKTIVGATNTGETNTGLAPVMDPGQFFGAAAMGYAAAKECPQVIAKLFCYCGCDVTDRHTSLLDCFTSTHGVDCHICQEEAMLALRLHNNGLAMEEIQKRIDQQYSSQYPFEQDTDTYKKYKTSRLWIKGDAAKTGIDSAATVPSTGSENTKAKLVPGCCSGKENSK